MVFFGQQISIVSDIFFNLPTGCWPLYAMCVCGCLDGCLEAYTHLAYLRWQPHTHTHTHTSSTIIIDYQNSREFGFVFRRKIKTPTRFVLSGFFNVLCVIAKTKKPTRVQKWMNEYRVGVLGKKKINLRMRWDENQTIIIIIKHALAFLFHSYWQRYGHHCVSSHSIWPFDQARAKYGLFHHHILGSTANQSCNVQPGSLLFNEKRKYLV
mgnify:CR=1 FL=1